MHDVMTFIDRQGEYKEQHIITIRHIVDGESTDQCFIEVAGMDDSVIISIADTKLNKLISELMNARTGLNTTKQRKRRELLSALKMTEAEAKEAGIDLGPLFSQS